MISGFSLTVPKSLQDEIAKSKRKGLVVPSYATSPKGVKGNKAKYAWQELVTIEDTEVDTDEKRDDVLVVNVKVRVHQQSSSPAGDIASPNIGTGIPSWWRINPGAVAAGDTKDGQFVMSRISYDRIEQLVSACGFEVPEDEAGNKDFLPYLTDSKPLVGHNVLVRLIDKQDDRSDNPDDRKQEITQIIAAVTD